MRNFRTEYTTWGVNAPSIWPQTATQLSLYYYCYNLLDFAYWGDTIRLSHFRKVASPLKPDKASERVFFRVPRLHCYKAFFRTEYAT